MKQELIELFESYKSEVDNFNDAIFEGDFELLATDIIKLFQSQPQEHKSAEEILKNHISELSETLDILEIDAILQAMHEYAKQVELLGDNRMIFKFEKLINKADKLLYIAKNSGRNRIET